MNDKQNDNESVERLQEWLKKPEKNPDNKTRQNATQLRPLTEENKDKAIEYLMGVVNRLRQERKKTQIEMYTDTNTGHLNAKAFHKALAHVTEKHIIDLSQNKTPAPTTIAVIDLNYLKPMNNLSYEGCGNPAIQYLINYISKNLRTNVQNTTDVEHRSTKESGEAPDTIGHLKLKRNTNDHIVTRMSEGDEFAVIMRGCDIETAKRRLNAILKNMAIDSLHSDNPCIGIDPKGRKVPLQVSAAVGYAQIPNELPNHEEKIAHKIATIKKKVLKAAGEDEKLNKESSKAEAAQVENGFPYAGTRGDAEKMLAPFLERRIQEFNNGVYIPTPDTEKKDIKNLQKNSPDYNSGQSNFMLGSTQNLAPVIENLTKGRMV